MTGTLVQLNVSPGGMPKLPVLQGRVTRDGVEGDWQKNRKYHGGPDRAVCVFSEELYEELRAEGVAIGPGSVGENFTTRGIDLREVSPGDQFRVGRCVIEITQVRVPCRNLNKWHPKLMKLIEGRSGWMAKVVKEGFLRPGDPIELLQPASPPALRGRFSEPVVRTSREAS